MSLGGVNNNNLEASGFEWARIKTDEDVGEGSIAYGDAKLSDKGKNDVYATSVQVVIGVDSKGNDISKNVTIYIPAAHEEMTPEKMNQVANKMIDIAMKLEMGNRSSGTTLTSIILEKGELHGTWNESVGKNTESTKANLRDHIHKLTEERNTFINRSRIELVKETQSKINTLATVLNEITNPKNNKISFDEVSAKKEKRLKFADEVEKEEIIPQSDFETSSAKKTSTDKKLVTIFGFTKMSNSTQVYKLQDISKHQIDGYKTTTFAEFIPIEGKKYIEDIPKITTWAKIANWISNIFKKLFSSNESSKPAESLTSKDIVVKTDQTKISPQNVVSWDDTKAQLTEQITKEVAADGDKFKAKADFFRGQSSAMKNYGELIKTTLDANEGFRGLKSLIEGIPVLSKLDPAITTPPPKNEPLNDEQKGYVEHMKDVLNHLDTLANDPEIKKLVQGFSTIIDEKIQNKEEANKRAFNSFMLRGVGPQVITFGKDKNFIQVSSALQKIANEITKTESGGSTGTKLNEFEFLTRNEVPEIKELQSKMIDLMNKF